MMNLNGSTDILTQHCLLFSNNLKKETSSNLTSRDNQWNEIYNNFS